MKLPGALHDHAAVVVVRRDLLALLLARHHVGAEPGAGIVGADLGRLLLEVARRVGAAEAAVHAPMAFDAFALDHGLDLGQRIGGVGQHALHDLLPGLGIAADALAGEALAHRRAAAHPAAVARRGADAEIAALQHRHVDARARQLQRRRQAAVARADHQHVGLERRVLAQLVGGMPPFPPPRRALEVLVEDAVGHGTPLTRAAAQSRARNGRSGRARSRPAGSASPTPRRSSDRSPSGCCRTSSWARSCSARPGTARRPARRTTR